MTSTPLVVVWLADLNHIGTKANQPITTGASPPTTTSTCPRVKLTHRGLRITESSNNMRGRYGYLDDVYDVAEEEQS